ncbi:MAG: carboxypeptidase regulatory-like domain-containing protein, partial [Acidobacteria bacterium]
MTTVTKAILSLMAVVVLLAAAQTGFGQNITTGTLTGLVMDAQKGVLPGATVVAVHVPTGTAYEAVTQGDGRFTMMAVRVGGPYTVKASMAGFKTQEQTEISVGLGESLIVELTLATETLQETVN